MQVKSIPGTSLGGETDSTQLGTPPVTLRTDDGDVWVDHLPSRGVGRRSRYISAVEFLFRSLSGLYKKLFNEHQKTLKKLETANAKLKKLESGTQQNTTAAATAANEIKHLKQKLQDAKDALEEANESHKLANQARDEKDEQRAAAVKQGIEALNKEHDDAIGLIQRFVMETLEQLEEVGALNQELEAQLQQTKRANQIFDETARLSQALLAFVLRVAMTIRPIEDLYIEQDADENQPEVLVVELTDVLLRYTQSDPPSLVASPVDDAEEKFLGQKLELGEDGLPTIAALLFLGFLTKIATTDGKQKNDATLAKDPTLYLQLFGTPHQLDNEAPTTQRQESSPTPPAADPTANWASKK